MTTPKQIFHAVMQPESRRYLYVGVIAVFALGVLALSGGSDNRQVTTGEQGGGSDDIQAGESVPGDSLSPDAEATGAAGSGKAGSKAGAKAAGTRVGVDIPISETEMAVGMFYVTNPGNANSAAGFNNIGRINQRRGWDAMVAEVNKKPPFGRKVKPVYYSTSEEDALSKGDALWDEACAHWTKDNKIFLAWSVGPEPLRACLTKAYMGKGVAQVGSGTGDSYAKTFKDHPWYVEHNTPAVDRLATFVVDQLFDRGYFQSCRPDSKQALSCVDGKPRIALLRYHYPSYRAAAATLKKALASHGLALCDGCEFEATHSTTNLAEQLDDATEAASAVLNCKSTHTANSSVPGTPPGPCTHVLFLSSTYGCRLSAFYAQAAEDQDFRPRLGLNSLDCPSFIKDYWTLQTGNEKYYNQFPASILVSHDPGDYETPTPAFQECKAIFVKAGETFGGEDDASNAKEREVPAYCDTAWYHLAAFNAAGKDLSLNAWLGGVANSGFVKSANTYLMRTTATRHDGAGAVRIGDWDAGGKRFRPLTGDVPV